MKKSITILILSTLFIACNNEPLDESFQEIGTIQNEESELPENTLVIKKIEDGDISSFFNSNGKIESIANPSAFTSNGLTYEFIYSNDDLINQSYYFASELIYTTLTYTNSSITNYNSITIGPGNNYLVTTNDNKVTLSSSNRILEYTFISNELKKLANYKDTRNGNLVYNIDFEYNTNGNLTNIEEIIINGDTINNSYTFTYDNKKNPVSESMNPNTLAYIIITGGYNLDRLIELSPNNIINNSKSQESFIYEYNLDNYPITAIKNNTTDGSLINTLTYSYY